MMPHGRDSGGWNAGWSALDGLIRLKGHGCRLMGGAVLDDEEVGSG